ncbi:hypothetical protein T552_03029 [Pneumocystis carinii B80]|uniref:Small ribosomal subunit protein mS33 n=1 Tax=Pneumocystis carinii (strain B80) TaxID=1408658 RepID=A0A0W4ZCH7_PNEC8|nr:hypothetical protein T552_03029 [Pneumocystis carinii B80]KTW26136.1 hypothetical protein T552_03029 [Pneumocystis carinii B80]
MANLPSKKRLLQLKSTACRIFGSIFNPKGLRIGTRVLFRRFPGPTISQYYSRLNIPPKVLIRAFPDMNLVDPDEAMRIEWVERQVARKRRGKGPPPKSNENCLKIQEKMKKFEGVYVTTNN